jgi:hypothetical protein
MPGKEETSAMKTTARSTQKMAQQAFGLLLELRTRHDAQQLLSQAVAFLDLLAREKEVNATPIMLSVRVMQLRRS